MKQRIEPSSGSNATAAEQLAAENQLLQQHLQKLIAQARDNEQILHRHHQINLKLIGAGSLSELLGCIFHDLKISASLDAITLLAAEAEFDLRRAMADLKIDRHAWPDLLLLPNMNSGDIAASRSLRPELGPFSADRHRIMFPANRPQPASVAIVPLRRQERLLGYLNFGSDDANRFNSSVATDFIEEQASIIAICLENVINNERLKHIGLTDPLTGVYNRRFIETRLQEEIRRAQRQGYALSCMYLDIDHFKQINDQYGHQDGDDVLREVAARIKAELRLSDSLGRFGGEEFVVLLVDASGAGARNVAERIRSGIANRIFKLDSGRTCQVTASIGVATLTADNTSQPTETIAQQLIGLADRALYQAKNSGRNRVVCGS
ncbi:MAG: sensor diguanylate cyclase [Burkholderiaceae bacterium]|nr:sensor diguanylate cyclase [Burkholderiaceae bacterium]